MAKEKQGRLRKQFKLTIPVRALGAEEFEDVNTAAAVGGLQDDCVMFR